MTPATLEATLAAAESSGMSNHILRILCILHESRPHAVILSHLADRLNVSRAAMTALSKDMIQRHLIERMPVTEDKRVSPVTITTHGANLLSRIIRNQSQPTKQATTP